ncbi:MAG: hypothetical protein U9Q69_01980 [Nanoarchaeota archaeon]|nr:hypothetical protein [Nanoarchaeota archaeon]
MKELLKNIEKIDIHAKRKILLDTCFLIDAVSKHEDLDKLSNAALTSFNIEEILFIEHKLGHEIKKGLRRFFKKANFKILEVPVHPGNPKSEKNFVASVDKELLEKIRDPSDAVLIAAAILTNSLILTKDKHHLFTTKLENFLNKYNIKVLKDIHSLDMSLLSGKRNCRL